MYRKGESFESPRLLYREICAADAEYVVRWRSDPAIYKYLRMSKPLTMKNHLEWYEKIYLKDLSRIDFIVTEKVSMMSIGTVCVSGLRGNSGEVGVAIGEVAFQGQGYATEAVNAIVCEYVKAGISIFYAEIHPENLPSIRIFEKCGFIFNKHLASGFLLYKKEQAN